MRVELETGKISQESARMISELLEKREPRVDLDQVTRHKVLHQNHLVRTLIEASVNTNVKLVPMGAEDLTDALGFLDGLAEGVGGEQGIMVRKVYQQLRSEVRVYDDPQELFKAVESIARLGWAFGDRFVREKVK